MRSRETQTTQGTFEYKSDSYVMAVGLEDLEESLSRLASKYPDRAGEFLKAQARKTRSGVIREMKSAVDVNTGNDKSLGKAKNYQISQVQGYGKNQEVELSAKSPHFHLIEHGHELLSHSPNKKPIGWVPGYLVMDAEKKRRAQKAPTECAEWANELLKEEGFL